jgi:uncharacterized protein HemX
MNTTPSPAHEWQKQRRKHLFRASAMLLLLILAAGFLFWSRHYLQQSRLTAATQARALASAMSAQAEQKTREQLAGQAKQLLQQAAARGITPESWARRRINLQQTHLPRNEANDFLLSIARTPNRFFELELFELSVTQGNSGIFDPPVNMNTPMLLNVRGTLIFRTERKAS